MTLDELIDQDDIPPSATVSELRFSGAENYAVSYQEDGGNTYREDDVYFTEQDGRKSRWIPTGWRTISRPSSPCR